jgi:hypothetical protein
MVCVCPARSRMFADQWQYEVGVLELGMGRRLDCLEVIVVEIGQPAVRE